MTTPKEIINKYEIKPKKKLGQSFLLDGNIIRKIAASADISAEDVIIEIGSGIGILTQEIARKAGKVIAAEIDPQLVEVLKAKLAPYSNAEIHCGDILKYDFKALSKGYKSKVKVIGNVPYNISSPLLFYLLSFRSVIDGFVLMLQKEVVERLVALPGDKSYGVPSVILQMFASVEKIFDVPATCFYPRPKVESAVIRGTFSGKISCPFELMKYFLQAWLKQSFAQRRKMLTNNLKNSKLLTNISEEKIRDVLACAKIDGKRRGETLSVMEFGKLSNMLYEAMTKL